MPTRDEMFLERDFSTTKWITLETHIKDCTCDACKRCRMFEAKIPEVIRNAKLQNQS